MADLPQILPCPFCGDPASVEEVEAKSSVGSAVRFSVGCSEGDGADLCMGYQSLTTFNRRGEAIEAWNKRAPAGDATTLSILANTSSKEKDNGFNNCVDRVGHRDRNP